MQPALDPVHLVTRLRAVCELHGGPAEVARLCGLKLPSLESYLSGKCLPGSMALAAISRGLGVSADWLLFGDERE
jgi:transcriptional regulator with XRE-family HTH domain